MEPRAGSRLPVRVEQVVNGALLVTVSCGQRSFAGILLDCTKKSGLFGLPPSTPLPQAEDTPVNGCQGSAPAEGDTEAMQLGTAPPPPACPEPPQPPAPPPPAGSLPPFPPYFEGAPFPPPLWLRNTYRQWVPQPPPRTIKRTRRRPSRTRDPGRLALSPICLRPRRVLCEKCKSTLSAPEASPGPPAAPRPRRGPGGGPDADREPRKHEDAEGRGDGAAWAAVRGGRRERRKEEGPAPVPRSPAIKISYSTPQGTGEVVEIPSRVHGSLEPFCPPQDPEAPRDRPPGGPAASIPKLKLTRPLPPGADLPPPKIRLKPHRPGAGEQEPVYRAELVQELAGRGRGPRAGSPALPAAHTATHTAAGGLADVSSGSSGEDDDCGKCPQGKHGRDGLAFLDACPRSRADCAGESVWSSDSLDESKSSGSDTCDLSSGDGVPVPPASKAVGPTVPPLTVRLHTQSVARCITEDGRTVAVGDIVWGKIHGFPWWPARVLDISLSQKDDGEPSWQEAKVSWFGSPTTSFLSTSKLSPFSEFFKLRFNRKKKGLYRKAITEAASAARLVGPGVRELLTQGAT